MRKTVYAFLTGCILLQSVSLGQTGPRFGFRAGYSMATQYGITPVNLPYTVATYYRHGVAGGLIIHYPITEHFGIQQEFLYAQKGSRQDITMTTMDVTTHTEYDINYFEIPVVFRYTFVRLGKIKLYGAAGFALSILLNGNYRLDGEAEVGGISSEFSLREKIEGLDTFDCAFLYGAGVEFRLFDKDWFFGYRFTIGWNFLMMPTYEGEDPAPLRNQDYIFTLGMFIN